MEMVFAMRVRVGAGTATSAGLKCPPTMNSSSSVGHHCPPTLRQGASRVLLGASGAFSSWSCGACGDGPIWWWSWRSSGGGGAIAGITSPSGRNAHHVDYPQDCHPSCHLINSARV